MTKRQQIGFKASATDEKEEIDNMPIKESITSADLDEIVDERVQNQKDYEYHMEEYSSLVKMRNNLEKSRNIIITIISIILVSLFLYCIYYAGYINGAKAQLNNEGPFIKITDKNNKIYIIKK